MNVLSFYTGFTIMATVFILTGMIDILYEDSELIAVLKPCGLAVQGGEGVNSSVDNLLSKQIGNKVYLIHRLDKETEGILLVAKNAKTASEYTRMFSDKDRIKKEYRALCIGIPANKKGCITLPVEGKPALSDYEVEKSSSFTVEGDENGLLKEFSLIKVSLKTGRMHQIRIHLASIGCPIVADDRHGDFKKNKLARKLIGAKKLQLASVSLTFPIKGGTKNVTIPLPLHMRELSEKVFDR